MAKLTVLGVGNVLMRDEGVGVALLAAVRDERAWGPDVEFIDGGAGGMNLLNVIESAERLVIFDAAEMRLPAGEHRVFRPEDVRPDRSDGRVSLHDMPLLETLELCKKFFRRPPTTIFAVQPAVIDHGRQLTPELAAAFPGLVAAAVQLIEDQLA